jgi:hypothetical protein
MGEGARSRKGECVFVGVRERLPQGVCQRGRLVGPVYGCRGGGVPTRTQAKLRTLPPSCFPSQTR